MSLLVICHKYQIYFSLFTLIQDHQGQEKPHSAKLSPRSCLSDCRAGNVTLLSLSCVSTSCSLRFLNLSVNSSLCRYSYGQFVEINSHSLFSKWFSEVHPAVSVLKMNSFEKSWGRMSHAVYLPFRRFCVNVQCIFPNWHNTFANLHVGNFELKVVTTSFSQSGKLVTKMFQKIQQLIDDKDTLVFVLIDEVNNLRIFYYCFVCFVFFGNFQFISSYSHQAVQWSERYCVAQVESLTAARNACQSGTEPSDAIRVVNSVLTQLDQIKRLASKALSSISQ